jgi:SAM-dependent methyltransferase
MSGLDREKKVPSGDRPGSRMSTKTFTDANRRRSEIAFTTQDHQPIDEDTRAAYRHYVRLRVLLDALSTLEFDTLLDVGCAEGFFTNAISERFGVKGWGVDIAVAAVAKMQFRYGLMGVAADGARLPFGDGAFDLVLCTETIEHVLDADGFFRELMRVARRYVVITTPASHGGDFVPDYELKDTGHVQQFTSERVRQLFGDESSITSFRSNLGFGLYAAVGRNLGRSIGRRFIDFDYWFAKRFGGVSRKLWPLRNRDWLIVSAGSGVEAPQLKLACPACHGDLEIKDLEYRCLRCAAVYQVRDGVPDFYEPVLA